MVKKAKTVGQLLAAVLKAAPGESVTVEFDGDSYIVDGPGGTFASGPKLYGAFKSIGKDMLGEADAAIAKLRGRVGA